jgi:2-polyprenyl-3-methyl-5-hydroxy-6-metoxy-1,4-benzoquinol methylase
MRRVAALSLVLFTAGALAAAQSQPPATPPSQTGAPPQVQGVRPVPRTHEEEVYSRFRAWLGRLSRAEQTAPDLIDKYRAKLAADGLSQNAIDEEIKIVVEQGQRLEIDQWNRILLAPEAQFNRQPNAFLSEMVKDLKPGAALDVGMGQGRNALFLAKQGWTVTGFDPAAEAVAFAQRQAQKDGLKVTTSTERDDQFDWGHDRWDLIVMSYVRVRDNVDRVIDSLRPGGVVVIEGFHRDATKQSSIGGGVVFDTNELLTLFSRLRVLRYEDTAAVGDFGLRQTRVVRLCAQKP